MASRMKNVLVLSGTASAMNYILSLTRNAAYPLHVTHVDPYCPVLYMPGVVPHVIPRARSQTLYRQAIHRLIEDHEIDLVIPTSDYDVEAVVEYLHDGWAPEAKL